METLHETRWNRKRAAQLLQVSYKTLLNRIQEFNLAP
ncbi:MAG: helix-turn-helix domain-containing protein [Thermodesulfobacteriota bacterium]|nr:helix-turn-helix domain-containing protein [Thermodesulfobacteriota bacterium]